MDPTVNDLTPSEPTYVTPIECPDCGAKAHLMRRTPAGAGEERTFECETCKRKTVLKIE